MTSRRAQRRATPPIIPLRLEARHGRIMFVYDVRAAGVVRVIGEHEQANVLRVAFPHCPEDATIAIIPGLSAPEEVRDWAADAPGQIPDHIGDRVLVTAVCEHIREQEAARMGWDGRPELVDLFDQYPTHWLVYAAMPSTREPEPSPL